MLGEALKSLFPCFQYIKSRLAASNNATQGYEFISYISNKQVILQRINWIFKKYALFYFKIVAFYEKDEFYKKHLFSYKKTSGFYKKLPIVIYKKLNAFK